MVITHELPSDSVESLRLSPALITCRADKKFAKIAEPLAYYDSLKTVSARRDLRGTAEEGRSVAWRESNSLVGESETYDDVMSMPPAVFRALKLMPMTELMARSEGMDAKQKKSLEIDLRITEFDELRALYDGLLMRVGDKLTFYRWFMESTEPSKTAERRFDGTDSDGENPADRALDWRERQLPNGDR